MAKYTCFLLFVLTFLGTISSCDAGRSGILYTSDHYYFIPGEFVAPGKILISTEDYSGLDNRLGHHYDYAVSLGLSLEKAVEGGLRHVKREINSEYYYLFPQEAYSPYGNNASLVKMLNEQELFRVVDAICALTKVKLVHVSTVFCTDKMQITADKEFAGRGKGTDISSVFVFDAENYQLMLDGGRWDPILTSGDRSVDSSFSSGKSFPGGWLRLLKSDEYEFFDDEVTLTLTVPVRRVLYLTWLNELIDNPEAPMPYQDEVMTTTVKLKKNIRIK